jgi:hypothetical protein
MARQSHIPEMHSSPLQHCSVDAQVWSMALHVAQVPAAQ